MKKQLKDKIDEIIRVNHAGEYGAQRIYSGQIRFCKNKELKKQWKGVKSRSEYKSALDQLIN